MSVLFYKRPDYLNKSTGPINAADCALYVERAKKSERAIPDGLSFDEVINSKTLPPCSLNDFMDYLVYIEHNAENLQFYIWFRDYERRFNALSDEERKLSPEWSPETKEFRNLAKDLEREATPSAQRNPIKGMIEKGYNNKGAAMFTEYREVIAVEDLHMSIFGDNGSAVAPSVSDATTTLTMAEVTAQAGLKWQAFTIQPMREEVNHIIRHYLAFTSPRELNLSHKDRDMTLHALQHTTHPSALKPAVKIAQAALRGQSHPNFIRWSICNGNKPRVFFVRTVGVSNLLFGFIIAILLTLSKASRWWRIFAALAWFIGISTMVAAYRGLCIILHFTHAHILRPWQQDLNSEISNSRRNSFSSTAQRGIQMASKTADYDDLDKLDDQSSFRPTSLQTFGPKNSFDDAEWVAKYEKKPLLRKVFEKSVWTQDETLRILQDRIVLGANLWGLIITTFLTVIFVAIPKGNFY